MNHTPDPSAYKRRLGLHEEPRSYGKHAPVQMVEVFAHSWFRAFQCPTCKQWQKLDSEDDAIGVDCAGDAVREAYEG